MRRLLRFVYAAVLIAVMIVLVRTFFLVRATQLAGRIVPSAAAGQRAAAAPSDANEIPDMPPPDAGRFTEQPTAAQLLAHDSLSQAMFRELSGRYQPTLAALQRATTTAGAKLVVVSFGTRSGKRMTELEQRAQPVIADACRALGISYYDFASALDSLGAAREAVTLDQDGHASRAAAAVIGAHLATIVRGFDGYRSPITYSADERPALFGDRPPNHTGLQDMGNGLPFIETTNAQGLRMNHAVTFPKTKQRVALLGSSMALFPFLDDDKTGTGVLQALAPDKEILNAAQLAYGIHDELWLFTARTRFAEPDVVVLEQSGMDIVRLFFTAVNFQDQTRHFQSPSALERAFYDKTYPQK